MDKTIEIGTIDNTYSWEYDTWSNVIILYLNLTTMVLNITVTKIHYKSGLGKGVFTKQIEDIVVGTLNKPNKGIIRSILSKYKQQEPFSKTGWSVSDDSDEITNNLTISDLLNYTIKNNKIVSRLIKIKSIKSKTNG